MMVLAAAQLALAIALALLAWRGDHPAALAALAAALVTDAVQRLAARRGRAAAARQGAAARRGRAVAARLSRWAEAALWVALPAAGAWLRPDVIGAWPRSCVVIVAAVGVPLVFGFIKYGAVVRHGARAAAPALYIVAAAVALVVRTGPSWLVVVAALAAGAAALEEVAITALLPRAVGRVASVGAAWRLRRARFSDPDRLDELV